MAATVAERIAEDVYVPVSESLCGPERTLPAAVPTPEMGVAGPGVVPLGLTKGQMPGMCNYPAGA